MRQLPQVLIVLALVLGAPAAADEPAPAAVAPATIPASTDPPEVVAAYDRGFQAIVSGDLPHAIQYLELVVRTSAEPARRAAARELVRLANALGSGKPVVVAVARPGGLDQNGRAEVVVSTTLASFYSGFVLADLFNLDDYRANVLVITGATAAGFAGSLLATRHARVSGGTAEAYTLGLWAGAANGLLLANRLGIDPDGSSGDGAINQSYLLFGLGAMALGGAGGYLAADAYQPTRAQIMFTNIAGITGTATAGLLLVTLDVQPSEPAKNIPMILALGLDLGVGAGVALTPHVDWSSSRVRYVGLSEFLGALAGFATGAVIYGASPSDDEVRAMTGLILAGTWAGLGTGVYFTRNMAPEAAGAASAPEAGVQIVPFAGRGGGGVSVGGVF